MDTAVGKQLSFAWKSVRRRVYQEEGAGNKEFGRAEASGVRPYSCERVRTPAIFMGAAARRRAAFYTRRRRSMQVADLRVPLSQGAPVRALRRLPGAFRAPLPVLRRPLATADQPTGRHLQGPGLL